MTQTSVSSREESGPSERPMTSDPGLGAGPVLCVSALDANLGPVTQGENKNSVRSQLAWYYLKAFYLGGLNNGQVFIADGLGQDTGCHSLCSL